MCAQTKSVVQFISKIKYEKSHWRIILSVHYNIIYNILYIHSQFDSLSSLPKGNKLFLKLAYFFGYPFDS